MELRIYVLIGIVLQAILSKASRIAGAIAGYVITTFILVYGISIYNKGGYIEFMRIELSIGLFILFCLIWYVIDTFSLFSAIKYTKKQEEELSIIGKQINPNLSEEIIKIQELHKAGTINDIVFEKMKSEIFEKFKNSKPIENNIDENSNPLSQNVYDSLSENERKEADKFINYGIKNGEKLVIHKINRKIDRFDLLEWGEIIIHKQENDWLIIYNK